MEHHTKSGKMAVMNDKAISHDGKTMIRPSSLISRVLCQGGFTLIELMIVMTLIGILATIAQPQFSRYTVRAREAALQENLLTLREVIDQYYADKGKYPDSLNELVENKYIRQVPGDPFTKSSETWITIPPDTGEGSVFDVHSGSDLISLDGKPYNEW